VFLFNYCGPPINPDAVLNRLIGEFPSVIKKLWRPSPLRSFACISGPACAIAQIVSAPIESTVSLNFSDSISDKRLALSISSLLSSC